MAPSDDRLDGLFELPPEGFTEARDTLVADLREAGDRDAASEVKKLRRPTVAAWAVNQLVRRHRGELQELLSVGEELRAAQREALSGGGAEQMREVTARRRRVVDRLLDRAEAVLEEGGHAAGRTTLDRVGETLMAATTSDDAAEAVRAGRLQRELRSASGFEAVAGAVSPEHIEARERRDRERVREAERAADEAEGEAARLARDADRLEREAERARRDAEKARSRAERAAERAEDLRREAERIRP